MVGWGGGVININHCGLNKRELFCLVSPWCVVVIFMCLVSVPSFLLILHLQVCCQTLTCMKRCKCKLWQYYEVQLAGYFLANQNYLGILHICVCDAVTLNVCVCAFKCVCDAVTFTVCTCVQSKVTWGKQGAWSRWRSWAELHQPTRRPWTWTPTARWVMPHQLWVCCTRWGGGGGGVLNLKSSVCMKSGTINPANVWNSLT